MLNEVANDSIFFHDNPLKPCPFCGGEPYMNSCDRLIQIGCNACDYHRYFHGLVQSEFETPVVTTYGSKTKEPIEWYDKDAYEMAAEKWNMRVTDEA